MTDSRDTMRWAWRGGVLAVLLIGWVFIAWQNRFHISAPVVFLCLGYLAVVATVATLWRTGASAVASSEGEDDSTWAKPTGALGELEREKRTLLKAIKEAEFDHQMGKLSKRDVDEMVRNYRARAIEVIKEIDRLGLGVVTGVRGEIMREVRARLELDMKSNKKAAAKQGPKIAVSDGKPEYKASSSRKQRSARAAGPAVVPYGHASPDKAAAAAVASGAPESPESPESPASDDASSAAAPASEPAIATAHAGPAQTEAANADTKAAAAAQAALDDEAMNADSTTTVEPRRSDSAKEATR